MKNTVKTAALVLSACLLLASCSQQPTEASAGYVITENQYVDYTFEYPDSWEVIRNDGMICVKNTQDNVTVSATSFDLDDPTMLVNDYWYGKDGEDGYLEQFKKTFGATVEIISEEETKLGGAEYGAAAKQITYNAEILGERYRFTQVVAVADGAVYTLTYTAKPETHDTWLSALTHAVSSFKFTF